MTTKKARAKKIRVDYRYTASGLDNVIIHGLEVTHDEDGEVIYCIPNINGLHRALTQAILTQETGISPKELRFIRTEMGMTQEVMAEILKVTRVTISRWETGKEQIDHNAEFVLRMIAAERLGLDLSNMGAEDVSRRCVWKAHSEPIIIDGSNPENYGRREAA